ncbi:MULTISPECIES: LysR family transcriptional regulator [Gammaproteobacteria]|uniref:LysR family transcriptional regulator n=2 Tax=Enterobacteriaceae TaxID=543 RepID=A0AAI9MLI9_CITFR|nr:MULTISPECIES: LysR family transcriptional regulator [Enterobacteriaceae]EKV7198485.1 LysR family transcriptional regulator [Citrobacter freundii]KLP95912.1 LysR family transcriptional regulator [Enterobacter roggenkampii]RNT50123.1 LysR family transcriptional regulator [Klebsiella quasipneumoniae subsp. quasipneumoniae]HDZ2291613.1 LysR family transcriptional regulator [Klebsiella pneumoniae]
MDRLACMKVFVKAVEAGSISSAADELNLSSQLAGKQIRALEDGLGIKLLNRTTRRQSLTDSGQLFYERAKNILAEMEAAEALMAETRSEPRGRLRISAPITFGSHGLAPEIPEYLRQHSEVSVDLSLTNHTVDLVEEGFDVVFRTGDLPDSSLIARRLASYRLALCAAASYMKLAEPLQTPLDLLKHECLVFSHTSLRTQWSFDGPEGQVTVPINGRFYTNSGEALRAAAVAGMGILLQPYELVADEIEAGRLIRLLPEYEPPARSLHVLYASDRRMTPKLRSFLDFAVKKFSDKRFES